MTDVTGITADKLKSLVGWIENLEASRAEIAADVREVYAEAKALGFETKIIRLVVRLRKMEEHARAEQDALTATYLAALGMIPDFEGGG